MAKRTGEGPKPHPHDSTLGESSREAQCGRRLLGTNGGSLWLWCCLAQPGVFCLSEVVCVHAYSLSHV